MKLTKKIVLLSTTAFFLLVFNSCKKDTTVAAATYGVPGLWVGTYTVDQQPSQAPLFYALSFKPDNTLTTESKGSSGSSIYSQGTWSLSGADLICNFSSINFPGVTVYQSAKFTFSTTSDTLTAGTWKDGVGGSNYTGKFQLIRKVK